MDSNNIKFDYDVETFTDDVTGIKNTNLCNQIFESGVAAEELARIGGSFLNPDSDDGKLWINVAFTDVSENTEKQIIDADVVVMINYDLTIGSQLSSANKYKLENSSEFSSFAIVFKPA